MPDNLIIEAGIAKFPSGRLQEEARVVAESAYHLKPTDEVYHIDPTISLDEVNKLVLAPGAKVLFARGGVWRGQLCVRSGIPGHPIHYGAYGTGQNPIIQPSHNFSSPSQWHHEADGLWSAKTIAKADIGNVILDSGSAGCLIRRSRRDALTGDAEYFFDPSASRIFVSSGSGNPASRWKSIELAEKIHCIDQTCAHDVVYDSLSVRFGAAHGFGGGGVKRISICNCNVAWIGGGFLYVDTLGNGVRYGNGIELWGGAEDVIVEGCTVAQCWDAGLTNQTNEPGSIQRNITWRGNTVENCEYSYEFWHQGMGGTCENIKFENNICRNAGSWGHAQRWNPNAAHLMLYDTIIHTPGFSITGNIFSRSANVLARVFNNWQNEAVFSNNTFESEGEPYCRYHDRPRTGLRYLYPDRLDQIHNDDQSEIEEPSKTPCIYQIEFPWTTSS